MRTVKRCFKNGVYKKQDWAQFSQRIIGNGRTDDVLELVDVIGEIEDHQSSVLQSNLTDKSILVVVNANLLLRLRPQHTTTT